MPDSYFSSRRTPIFDGPDSFWVIIIAVLLVFSAFFGTIIYTSRYESGVKDTQLKYGLAHYEVDKITGRTNFVVTGEPVKELKETK